MLIRPYIDKLTPSEFHTVLVGSHASIAGFAYAIFVWFGVSPQHLLTAAVMSAPAAVAISKLNYPETQESHFKDETVIQLSQRLVEFNRRPRSKEIIDLVPYISMFVYHSLCSPA